MTTGKALDGKPYAGNPHVRFDEGEVASAATPRRGSLLYKRLLTIGAMAMSTMAIHAGIKYWDNPDYRAFDVTDYAEGAVWNYDGIRNQGADQPHSTNATTWVNLGTSGSSNNLFVRVLNQAGTTWQNSSALASLGTVNERDTGSWTENGFTLTGDSHFRSSGSISTGTDFTIQMLVDSTISGQFRANPYLMAVAKDNFAFYVDKASSRLYWKTQDSTTANHPFLSDATLGYVTAILNGSVTPKTATFFSGTMPPTSGDGYKEYSSVVGKNDSGYCICGCNNTDGQMVGTVLSYRYYKRVLTPEELVWNRVVDEARFFNRVAPIPFTNVVVATSKRGVNGTEPVGCYAVEASGHTFTAPASQVFRGRTYSCSGYTIETWDGSVWSAPVAHDAATSYTATDAAKVRLTWQWSAGDGIVTYDIDDYVWNGLVWFYDGINNVGKDLPHDNSSLNWVNLGSSGASNDLFLQRLNAAGTGYDTAINFDVVEDRDPGTWIENGFVMKGDSRFRRNSPGGISAGTDYTLQTLVDVMGNEQRYDSSYVMAVSVDKFAIQLKKTSSGGELVWKVQDSTHSPFMSGPSFSYATAILNGTSKTAALFSGTTAPTSGTLSGGFWQFDTLSPFSESGYCLGGRGASAVNAQLVGTIKFFRYYDHALSQAELERNRAVDNYRYFGPNTNVVVMTTNPNLQGNEKEGVYEVSGSYTFTAPTTLMAKGVAYTNDGYTVETWDGAAWSTTTVHAGNSYAYTVSAGKVRLTWKWRAVYGLRTVADYSFDDYSQAGLVWNYDGIRNQGGTDADHDSSATVWKNLGNGGSKYDLDFWNGTTTGEWVDDGYMFRGGPRFRSPAKVGPVKSFTVQSLVDADIDEQNANGAGYIMSAMWDYLDLAFRNDGNYAFNRALYWNAQATAANAGNHSTLYFKKNSGRYDYATAIMDYDNRTAALFDGTEVPTSGTGFKQFSSVVSRDTYGYGLGNNSDGNQGLVGTLKSIRYYDRVLTQEELVRNRNVDAVRYFGALGVTNVFVVAGGGVQNETGAYKVEGSWEFTAMTTVNKRGKTVNVERYSVEELVNGEWRNKQIYSGRSYTYTEG